ncbi:probable pectinesterase 29 isoform X2 [Salvia miltiorrhiza]|uniref:probable pectinesterase 29 isoform X2 n=1 Tax=Salvia miltiorrhiza TaxID=226208 RepID=UPI0025AC228C|nr:probable pectinesterase 29 isoform X2 [Salvia miltiorrhiza]
MPFLPQLFVYTLLALSSPFSSTNAAPNHRRSKIHHTFDVDPSGKGHFTTIQDAIDAVPSHNQRWTCIRIKKGVYREQVSIPYYKPFIFLKGEGKRNTYISWDGHDSIATGATFSSDADNTIAQGISFVNSYNNATHNPMRPAVAAKIQGDKSAFHRCGFYGLQDTLWDAQGRHYFKECTIQGSVDFIFGAGQSLYEKCSISVVANVHKVAGYITAQGRSKARETNGFVFKDCEIVGKGKAYLGRAWRDYATVLFYNTSMSDVVVPQGWNAWKQLRFAEHKCRGRGSNTSRRVKWANKLSDAELRHFTSISFIDNQGWLRNLPFNVFAPST